MDCVSDQIRFTGNLGLGICAVPNGCDADSGEALGKCVTYFNTEHVMLALSMSSFVSKAYDWLSESRKNT